MPLAVDIVTARGREAFWQLGHILRFDNIGSVYVDHHEGRLARRMGEVHIVYALKDIGPVFGGTGFAQGGAVAPDNSCLRVAT